MFRWYSRQNFTKTVNEMHAHTQNTLRGHMALATYKLKNTLDTMAYFFFSSSFFMLNCEYVKNTQNASRSRAGITLANAHHATPRMFSESCYFLFVLSEQKH